MIKELFSIIPGFFKQFKKGNQTVSTNPQKPMVETSPDSLNRKKDKIQKILNVFETGSLEGDYSKVSIYEDGPNEVLQITYGRSQTTEYGNLGRLIKMYVDANGEYSAFFKPYLGKIGKIPLVHDRTFIAKLKEAGKDQIMKKTQDEFFDQTYWADAVDFAKKNGFTHPLSMLVIYDSYIHSGGILPFLRKRFTEVPPAKGGNEKEWIKQYLTVRHEWLKNHSSKILRKTIYRTQNMLDAIKDDNWSLDKPFNANGIIAKDKSVSSQATEISFLVE